MLGTTFGGNHLACAAAIAVLDVIQKEQLVKNAEEVGTYIMKKLAETDIDCEIRGKGLMIGLEFKFPIAEIRKKLLFEHNIFTGVSGQHIIRLLPPLCMGVAEANTFIHALDKVFTDVSALLAEH
jgi:acetylornithine aminotransferase